MGAEGAVGAMDAVGAVGAVGAEGAVVVRMLTEKKCTANPAMPRPGLVVNDVPAEDALMRLAATPDFSGSRLLKYADPSRFVHDGGIATRVV
jgi:hypothetical protein